jgi:hypothetical protein
VELTIALLRLRFRSPGGFQRINHFGGDYQKGLNFGSKAGSNNPANNISDCLLRETSLKAEVESTPTDIIDENSIDSTTSESNGEVSAVPDSTDSSFESAHSGRGETSSISAQKYSGSSNIPSAGTSDSGSGTGPQSQSSMSGTNSNVAASTTSASSIEGKTEETKAGGGAGRGSCYSNSENQVGHPPDEPENYYELSGKSHPKPCQKKEEDGQQPDVTSKGQSTTTLLNLDRESNQACEPNVITATYSLIGNDGRFSSE